MVRASVRRAAVLATAVLTLSLTGCLGDDIWREPFVWREAASLGENQDAAQALAAALGSLGDQAAGQAGQVVEDIEDLPDNVVFQNAKEFLNGQAPGMGDEADDAVHLVTGTAGDAVVTLTGEVAAAYASAVGPILGTAEPATFEVDDRTTRLRWTLDVVLEDVQPPEAGQNPTPLGAIDLRIVAPDGSVKADYHLDTTRQLIDQVIEGTFGDRNEVRGQLGGEWQVEVTANAEGSWSLVVEAYEPEFDDYEWWQFWRAERRQVARG